MLKYQRRFKPWILYLPTSFQANPLGLAIALMLFIAGLVYLIMGAPAGSIAMLLDSPILLRIWGFVLCAASAILATGIFNSTLETEKLGLRLLSLALFVFGLWLVLAVGAVGAISMAMCLLIVFFCQLRIGVIKELQNPWVPPPHMKGRGHNGT